MNRNSDYSLSDTRRNFDQTNANVNRNSDFIINDGRRNTEFEIQNNNRNSDFGLDQRRFISAPLRVRI